MKNSNTLSDDLFSLLNRTHSTQAFINNICEDASVYLFGGSVRDYLENKFHSLRDLDFVVLANDGNKVEIERYIPEDQNIKVVKNRFDGYKVFFGNYLTIDIWNLADTWGIKEMQMSPNLENLAATVYLNIDALLYSVNTGAFINDCDKKYKFIKETSNEIDILCETNPFEKLNLLRAIILQEKYKFLLSKKIRKKIVDYYANHKKKFVDELVKIQTEHYGEKLLSEQKLPAILDHITTIVATGNDSTI
jgi:hypothetical protein